MNISKKLCAAVTAVLLSSNYTLPFVRAGYTPVTSNISYDTGLVIFTETTEEEPPPSEDVTEEPTEESTYPPTESATCEESWEAPRETEPVQPSEDPTEPSVEETWEEPTEEPTYPPTEEPAPTEPPLKLTEYSQTAKLNVNYDGNIVWLSGDTSIVTVENSVVTAVGNGSAVIYAVCGDSRAEINIIVDYDYYLSDSELTLDIGNQKQLGLYSSHTNNAVNPLAVWSSSDTDVVIVDSEGILTAVSAGTAEITAEIGDIIRTCKVNVPAKSEISVGSTQIQKGNSTALSVSNYTGSVTWVSSDTKVVTVSSDGVMTGVNAGTAVIYAMLENGKTLSYEITVTSDETVKSGDVNEDGTVDIRDVIMLNQSIFGKISLTPSQVKNPDVTGDGLPDSEDALVIMKYIVKLITSFD